MFVIESISWLFSWLLSLKIPSICVLEGHSLAGGFMLAMSHDIIISLNNESIKIGMTEINLGMTIPLPMLAPLMAKLNHKNLRDICLFGLIINPNEAYKWNIIDYLVKEEEIDSLLFNIIKNLKNSMLHKLAYQGIKKNLYNHWIK